jgi:hypothetical protein
MRSTAIGVFTVSMLLSVRPAAQIGYLWSAEELRAKSDVVAIATPIRTTETETKTELRELQPPFPVVELQTAFRVLTILKGNAPQPILLLRHYRADESRLRSGVIGGARALSVSDLGSEYLLFLRRDRNGALIPTSGHVSPGDSVFVLRKAG